MSDKADLTLTGDPVRPAPDAIAAMNAQFDNRVDVEVARQREGDKAKHTEALSLAAAKGQNTAALATLGAMIEGNPGDTVDALKFRSAVQDMVLAIHNGSDKPAGEYVKEAMKLN